jgi:hypothetical protein
MADHLSISYLNLRLAMNRVRLRYKHEQRRRDHRIFGVPLDKLATARHRWIIRGVVRRGGWLLRDFWLNFFWLVHCPDYLLAACGKLCWIAYATLVYGGVLDRICSCCPVFDTNDYSSWGLRTNRENRA